MDGDFVPNITFGSKFVEDVRPFSKLPFDVHLMTRHPETHIESFASAGADYITFHLEAALHVHRTLSFIHSLGKKAGLAIVPSTPAAALCEVLQLCDLVLVMTVNPGFGGQSLIAETLKKVRTLSQMRTEGGHKFLISVDGGINLETAPSAIEAGSDVLVAGKAFFDAKDKRAFVRQVTQRD